MSQQYPPQPPWGPPPPSGYYASFGQRVVATLWDVVYVLPAVGVMLLGAVIGMIGLVMVDEDAAGGPAVVAIGVVVLVAGFALQIWLLIKNVILRQGRTGYTWGKARVGIRCILEINGQPSGVANAVARYFLHSVINQACYLDYLWAAWDPKNQTLTDKLLRTVVVNQPEGASAR